MAKLIISFGLDSIPPEAKDQFIAPKISDLLTPNPPDISAHRKYPLNGFIMNYQLSLALTNQIRQACFNFIRNAEGAFDGYCDARTALLNYLQSKDRTVAPYFAALRHFEHCLAHLYLAVLNMNVIGKEKQFERNDGSVLERVSVLHAHVKHMEKHYSKVAIRDEISFNLFATRDDGSKSVSFKIGDAANVPIWITNEGLECPKANLTYSDLAEEVMSTLREAVNIAVLEPPKAKSSCGS